MLNAMASNAQPDQIRPQTIDPGGIAALGNGGQTRVVQFDVLQQTSGGFASVLQRLLSACPLLTEGFGRGIEIQPATNDLTPLLRHGLAIQGDIEAEAVE